MKYTIPRLVLCAVLACGFSNLYADDSNSTTGGNSNNSAGNGQGGQGQHKHGGHHHCHKEGSGTGSTNPQSGGQTNGQ